MIANRIRKYMPIINKYHYVADWRTVEGRLASEADSLADLLAMLREFVPSSLLDETGWSPVLETAGYWPASVGALPFGFEFHLLDTDPQADFGATLGPGGKTAEWIGRQAESAAAPEYVGRLARILDEMKAGSNAVGRELGRIILEFDLAFSSSTASRGPGVFLYYSHGEARKTRDSDAVLAALNAACGWPDQAHEFGLARRFSLAVKLPLHFVSLGAFPSRGRGFRLTAGGFPTSADAISFLRGVGWPGNYDLLTEVLERLKRRRAFRTLGLMLYGQGGGLRSKLGLYLKNDSRGWPSAFEALAAEGCVAGKLAGLDGAVKGPPTLLWGNSGEYKLVR